MIRKLSLFLTLIFLLSGAMNLFAQPQSCVQPPSGMVAWFPFDENNGATTANLIAGGNQGTLMNNPTWVSTARVANSLNFDGQNDFVEVADQPQLDFGTGDFSIDAWIRTTQQGGPIVDKRAATNQQGYMFFIFNNRLALQLNHPTGGFFNYFAPPSSPTVNTGTWQHVAVTIDRDNPVGITWYVSGVPYNSPSSNPMNRQGDISNNSPLRIGGESNGGSFFNGGIDEVELFNRVLTAEEVRSIAQAGAFGKCKRTCCGEGESLVRNGNFNQGNNMFQSSYSSQFTNFLPGNYWVGNSLWATQQCENWRVNGHTNCNNPQDNFLLINGMTNNPSANPLVWSQTVNVPISKKEETYYFCAWFKDLKQCCFNKKPQITMQGRSGANTSNQNATISAGSQACDWQLVSSEIKVPAGTTTADLRIILDGTVLGDGNDLAIDDISFRKAPVTPSTSGNIATSDSSTPGKYRISGTGGAVTNPTCRTLWSAVELVGGVPSGTPITWTTNNTNFQTFGGGNPDGLFDYTKSYRIRYNTECDCAKDGTKFREWILVGNVQLRKVQINETKVTGSSIN